MGEKAIKFPVTSFFLFAILGISASLLAFYPGWMSLDSKVQYNQAVSGEYNDWHPVMMALWWSFLNQFTPGPFLLFLQNQIFFWFSFAFFGLGLWVSAKKYAYLIFVIGFIPSFWLTSAMIWKDVASAVSLLLTFSIIFFVSKTSKNFSKVTTVSLILLVIWSVCVKPNTAVIIPVVVAYYFQVLGKLNFRKKDFWITTIVLFTGVSLIFLGLNYVLKAQKMAQYQITMVGDLIGIANFSGENVFPQYINDSLQAAGNPTYVYKTSDNDGFFGIAPGLIISGEDPNVEELHSSWIRAITHYPNEYVKHRIGMTTALLRIGFWYPRTNLAPVSVIDDSGDIPASAVGEWVFTEGQKLHYLWYPWITVLAGIIPLLLAGISRRKLSSDYLFIGIAGIAYFVPFIFLTPAADYRYLFFTVLASAIAFVVGTSDLLFPVRSHPYGLVKVKSESNE